VHTGHVQCDSHVTEESLGRPLEHCLLGPPGCPVHTGHVLFNVRCIRMGVPDFCVLLARFWRALNALQVAVGADIAVAPLLHRTVRCTPDSPVNFSGTAEVKTRGWRVPEAALPWSTGHVRCTPDSPVNYSGVTFGNSRE
jgi:hypothetical protein